MSSKFLISAIFFFQFISIWCGRLESMRSGYPPDLTGLIRIATISRTTYLYATDINLSFTIYQRPVNNMLKQTLRVLNVSTNVDSTNRCIGYGLSFDFWRYSPIMNNQATGNGGCDGILGSACSQSIHNLLQESFGDIGSVACGVRDRSILHYPPKGCPQINDGGSQLIKSVFAENRSFIGRSPAWFYYQNWFYDNSEYDDLMKKFAFVFFVGRPYSSGKIDSAIACFPIYNTTA